MPVTAEQIAELRAAAQDARRMNHSPYSNFTVLAAVMTCDGRVYGGSNVENVNFTLTKHAEETASLAAIADGVFERLGRSWLQVVYIAGAVPPCGGCRQWLREFAAPGAVCVLDAGVSQDGGDGDGSVRVVDLDALLPESFGPEQLLPGT